MQPNDKVFAESGELSWMSMAIQMQTGTSVGGQQGGFLGEVVQYDLQPGNTIRVHPGHVGMFQEGVQFNIVTVPGIQNIVFGGSGLFLAALTGPGRVWLHSLSMQHLAHAIQEYLPKPAS